MEELSEEIFTREMNSTQDCVMERNIITIRIWKMKVMKVISKCDELLLNTSLLILFN